MKPRTLLALAATGLILAGCSKDAQDGSGRLRINFDTDVSVNETTRALGTLDGLTAPAAGEFSLQVVKDDASFDQTWPDITLYPGEGYYLETGNYTATALCGDVEQEGFGLPCFGASKTFVISNQLTTQVEMTATLLNMAVTVECTDLFKGYFPEHNTVISRDGATLADFSAQPDGIAFVKPNPFKVGVSFTYQDNGTERTGSREFEITGGNVKPRTHHRIVLDVNEGEGGSVSIEVTFDPEVETIVWPVIEAGDEE